MPPPRATGSYVVVLPTLAALLFLAALVALLSAVSLIFPGPAWAPMWNLNPPAGETFHSMGRIAPTLLLALAALAGTAAIGLLLHKKWAWAIALILFAANLSGDLVSLIRTRDILRFGSGVLIAAAFIYLLIHPSVRRAVS